MSDEDSFENSRSRNPTFTVDEKKILLKLASQHSVINNKKLDSKSTKEKQQAWEKIHQEFSSSKVSIHARSPHQLKRCWENIRCKAKKGDNNALKLMKWFESYKERVKEEVDLSSEYAEDDISHLDDSCEDIGPAANLEFDGQHNDQSSPTQDRLIAWDNCDSVKVNDRNRQQKFFNWKKLQKERIFKITMHNLKASERREIELHKLKVHEMTLRIENERRRAEILDRELGRP